MDSVLFIKKQWETSVSANGTLIPHNSAGPTIVTRASSGEILPVTGWKHGAPASGRTFFPVFPHYSLKTELFIELFSGRFSHHKPNGFGVFMSHDGSMARCCYIYGGHHGSHQQKPPIDPHRPRWPGAKAAKTCPMKRTWMRLIPLIYIYIYIILYIL